MIPTHFELAYGLQVYRIDPNQSALATAVPCQALNVRQKNENVRRVHPDKAMVGSTSPTL